MTSEIPTLSAQNEEAPIALNNNQNKKKKILLICLTLIFLFLLSLGSYYLGLSNNKNSSFVNYSTTESIVAKNWLVYEEKIGNYQFSYPKESYVTFDNKEPYRLNITNDHDDFQMHISNAVNFDIKKVFPGFFHTTPPMLIDCNSNVDCNKKFLSYLRVLNAQYLEKNYKFQREKLIKTLINNNQIDGIEYEYQEMANPNNNEKRYETFFIFPKGERIWIINISQIDTGNKESFANNKNVAYQIISSLKISEKKEDLNTWLQYTNSYQETNFTVSYPSIGIQDGFVSDFYFFPLVNNCAHNISNYYESPRTDIQQVGDEDSLWMLSTKFYGSGFYWPEIAKANNLPAPYTIYKGQNLNLPQLKNFYNIERFFVVSIVDWTSSIKDFVNTSLAMAPTKKFCNFKNIDDRFCNTDSFYKYTEIKNTNADEAYMIQPTDFLVNVLKNPPDCNEYSCENINPMFSFDNIQNVSNNPPSFLYKNGNRLYILNRESWHATSVDFTKGCSFLNEDELIKSGMSLKFGSAESLPTPQPTAYPGKY
jgi:hypothetical protein